WRLAKADCPPSRSTATVNKQTRSSSSNTTAKRPVLDAGLLFCLTSRGMGNAPISPSYGHHHFRLWLWAPRPIELIIDAGCQHVQIGAYGHRRNRREIIIFATEIVEVILDLAGDIFYEAKLNSDADGKTGTSIGKDLRRRGDARRRVRRRSGQKIFCVPSFHPGAATLGVEQPIVSGVTNPSG